MACVTENSGNPGHSSVPGRPVRGEVAAIEAAQQVEGGDLLVVE
jgi:hypothetical protein